MGQILTDFKTKNSCVNPSSCGSDTELYSTNIVGARQSSHDRTWHPLAFSRLDHCRLLNDADLLDKIKSFQLHHPAAANTLQSTDNMAAWLHKNYPGPLEGADYKFGNTSKMIDSSNLQIAKQAIEADKHPRTQDQPQHSTREQILDLTYRSATQEIHQSHPSSQHTSHHSPPFYASNFSVDQLTKPTTIPSNDKNGPTTNVFSHLTTPSHEPGAFVPKQRKGRRHHRTATPEQHHIRAFTNTPIYTMGIDPQTDRGLLCDFFEDIKRWVAAYIADLRTMNAEQIHNLESHDAITHMFNQPSQFSLLITEKDILIALVTSIMSRYIFMHTIDEHALFLSGHQLADLTEQLVADWTPQLSQPQRKEWLLRQRDLYTAIKNVPNHKAWRTDFSQTATTALMAHLAGLLAENLPPNLIKERDHQVQEFFIKGMRIGFRMRMAATRWSVAWPVCGAGFCAQTMVNESRMLYGDIMSTLRQVMALPNEHRVQFAVSPTMWRSEFEGGVERKEVVHSALVHLTRKGWV
ncbi:hypothetical protein GQ44DRAFT_815856 [Phaeosphaeriaceae sp. PMI808]|nr:hypothetical protein GQ44DRAFT_815856 [Phaeosphaeriaceae sp. PMI808]